MTGRTSGQPLRLPYGITWSTDNGSYAQTGYVYPTILAALAAAQRGHDGQDSIQVDPVGGAYPEPGQAIYAAIETDHDVVARVEVEEPRDGISDLEWLGRWVATDHGQTLMREEMVAVSNGSSNGGKIVEDSVSPGSDPTVPPDEYTIRASIRMVIAPTGEVLRVIVEPDNGVEFVLETEWWPSLTQDEVNEALSNYLDSIRIPIDRDKYPYAYPLEWEG